MVSNEKVGLVGLGWKSCSILFFSKGSGNTSITRKNDVGKTCNSEPLSHDEKTEFQFPAQSTPTSNQICTCYDKFQLEFIGSIDLLRAQSLSTFPRRLIDLLWGQGSSLR